VAERFGGAPLRPRCAAGVPLVAEALFRADLDRLDLETVPLGQDGIGAPRAHGRLSHRIILPDTTATAGAAWLPGCDQQF
jgi:hypothetical protein